MKISKPRNRVQVFQASVTLPFSTTQVTRRCPSMRVIGSITTLVFAITHPLRRSAASCPDAAGSSGAAVATGAGCASALAAPSGLSIGPPPPKRCVTAVPTRCAPIATAVAPTRMPVNVESETPPMPGASMFGVGRVERRHVVPELRLAAADARPGLDAPALVAVPARHGAGRVGDGPLAAHLEPAPLVGAVLVAERLDVLAVLEVRAPLAVVVDELAVQERRPADGVERRAPSCRRARR